MPTYKISNISEKTFDFTKNNLNKETISFNNKRIKKNCNDFFLKFYSKINQDESSRPSVKIEENKILQKKSSKKMVLNFSKLEMFYKKVRN